MPKCIAVVFAAAWKLVQALFIGLFSQPKGRHSAEQLKRRRSTRVRRYAPMVPAAPEPLPAHPTVHDSPVEPAALESPALEPPALKSPALKPATTEFDAGEVALVRPYFTAHESAAVADAESEACRIQGRATARLRAWGADLDHLEFGPDSNFSFGPPPAGTRAYTLDEYPAPDPDPEPEPAAATGLADTFHVPASRIPAPRVPARMDGLPHLSRIRARQQERRGRGQDQDRHSRVLEGAGV